MQLQEHIQEVLRNASSAFLFKVIAAAFGFVLNVQLARMLGAEGAGIYYLAFTITTIIATVARVGLDNVILKIIAVKASQGNWVAVAGVYRQSMTIVAVIAITIAGAMVMIAPTISGRIFLTSSFGVPLKIMMLSVVPLALFTLHAFSLQGLKKTSQSTIVLGLVAPLITIISLPFLVPRYGVGGAASGYLIGSSACLLVARLLWRRALPDFENTTRKSQIYFTWTKIKPFFWVSILQQAVLWISTLALGIWGDEREVGIFSAANRVAMLMIFILYAINSISAPKFAELYQAGQLDMLEKLARHTTSLMAAIGIPFLGFFILFSKTIMGIFGSDFVDGWLILVIIASGLFVNICMGSVGSILMMCGGENLMRNQLLVATVLCIVLNLALVPTIGIVGAAIATALIHGGQAVLSSVMVYRKFGFKILPFMTRS